MEIVAYGTTLEISAEPWNQGIVRLALDRADGPVAIPFLLPALTGHHFFTGVWPPPPDAVDYEPHTFNGELTPCGECGARYHQPATPYTKIETTMDYEIVGPGQVEIAFETVSHAESYPHGYVGLFFGTLVPHGGQRGIHTVVRDSAGLRWRYFCGRGDSDRPRENTMLGPTMAPAVHDPGHPPTYFFEESEQRFALPIQVGRFRNLYYCLEVDTPDVAFTDVLLGTAVGGPSWDLSFRLAAGQRKRLLCRLTVGEWVGWGAIEDSYRSWCMDAGFAVESVHPAPPALLSLPPAGASAAGRESGLALSRRLFETRGESLLRRLDLLDRCSVACVGGTSQNAGLDDELSRDHIWGPYLTFVLFAVSYDEHHARLAAALEDMPDELDGFRWQGYGGPAPRRTAVVKADEFLTALTGLPAVPATDAEWIPLLSQQSFLGRPLQQRMFDASQGEVFHDPGKQFTSQWRHRTGYVPPSVHRALLARGLFRVWNAGPEYNLLRALRRSDPEVYAIWRVRFADEVMQLAFAWNERYVPHAKWRLAHFRRLPILPVAVRDGVRTVLLEGAEEAFAAALEVVASIKALLPDLYHLSPPREEPLSAFAHAMRDTIDDPDVRSAASLDW